MANNTEKRMRRFITAIKKPDAALLRLLGRRTAKHLIGCILLAEERDMTIRLTFVNGRLLFLLGIGPLDDKDREAMNAPQERKAWMEAQCK